jgi:hypothetical protein
MECRPVPRRPRPLGLAPRAAGTARKTGLSSRPASPSRTGQSPDLRATCHAPHRATVAPPLKATSRATTVGPHPRTLDLTRARKRPPGSQIRAGANEQKCQRKDKVPGCSTQPSLAAPRPRLMPKARSARHPAPTAGNRAPRCVAGGHGPKTVGCPNRSWSSSAKRPQRNGARGPPSSNTLRRGARRAPAPPRCYRGAIRTRGVCRSQTDRVRRSAPTRAAPRHRPSEAVAAWRVPGRPAPGLPGFAAARIETRATGAQQGWSSRDPLFAVRAARPHRCRCFTPLRFHAGPGFGYPPQVGPR